MATYDLTIAVPVYNEEKTVSKILERIADSKLQNYELIVINDASKDSSQEIIERFFADNPKLRHTLITHAKNKGKGAGIQSALKVAKGRYFVIQDADLEYHPKDLVKLTEHTKKDNTCVAVYGSRFLGTYKNMHKANYYANKFYNRLLRVMYDTAITDMHTCYKMVRTDVLRGLDLSSNGFGYASELVSKLLKSGVQIHEVPISFYGRTKQEGKKIGYLDGIECILDLIKYRLKDLT